MQQRATFRMDIVATREAHCSQKSLVNKMTFPVLQVIGTIGIVSAITGCKPTLTQANASK
jgi:hypothetical protein